MNQSPLPWGLDFRVDAGAGFSAGIAHEQATGLLHASVRNDGSTTATVGRVLVRAEIELAAAGGCAWLTGHAPGSPARTVSLGSIPAEADGRLVETRHDGVTLRSAIMMGIHLPVRVEPALVVGLATLQGADATVNLALDPAGASTRSIDVILDLPGAVVEPGETLTLPAIFLASGRDLLALFEDYADAAAAASGSRPVSPPPVCWLAPADRQALEAGLAALGEAQLGVDTVVVPPGDAAAIAAVRAAGLRAGVQLAAGDGAGCAAAVAAGAGWFSVGGLGDATITDARSVLAGIREAIGDGAYLHVADAPFAACLGLADACSVVGPQGAALVRWWMDGAWWTNDAGVVLPLNSEPRAFDLAITALSGGMVTLDGTPTPATRAAVILPPTGVAARPVELAGEPIPFTWRALLDGGRALHGLVNATPRPRWAVAVEQLQPGEIAYDQVNGRLPGMGDPLVGAGEAVLWLVHAPGPGPRLIGDSASPGGRGLMVRQVSGQLHIRNDLAIERTVAVESRGRVFELVLRPGQLERVQ